MKKIVGLFLIASISATASASQKFEDVRQQVDDAGSYALCMELKLRTAKGDEKLMEANCPAVLKSFELNMERDALIRRIQAIEIELRRLKSSQVEMP